MNEKETTISEAKPETRLQKAMRGAWRWVLVALLAFGLGALLIVFTLYVPTWQKLDKANADLEQRQRDTHHQNRSDHNVADGYRNPAKESGFRHAAHGRAQGIVRCTRSQPGGGRRRLRRSAPVVDPGHRSAEYPVWPAGDGAKRRVHCHATKRRSGIGRCADRPQVSAAGAGSVDAKLSATGGEPVPQPVSWADNASSAPHE